MGSDAQTLFQSALKEFQSGNFQDAEKLLEQFLTFIPNNLDGMHLLAIVLASQGRHQEAISSYKKVLNLKPSDISVLSNLSSSLHAIGLFQEALSKIESALKINPKYFAGLYNAANLLCDLKRYQEAIIYYKKVLQIKPDYIDALNNCGKAFHDLGLYEEAISYYCKALNIENSFIPCLINIGISLNQLKRYQEAITYFDSALALKSDLVEAWFSKGDSLNALKRYEDASANYDQGLSLRPSSAMGWFKNGNALYALKRYEEAIAHYDEALKLKSDFPEAWANKGLSLIDLRRYEEAIAQYIRALDLKPEYAEAWSNKGVALNELMRFEEAITHYEKALELNSDYAEAWANKGVALNELKLHSDAISHYEKSINLKSDINWVYGDYFTTKMKICDWSDFSNELHKLVNKVLLNEKVINPFSLLSLIDRPTLHKQASEIYIQEKYPTNFVLGALPKRPKGGKIRVGYFSADFHNHATGYLMAELFELHNKSQFELIGFSFGPLVNDDMRQRLEKSFDQFIDVGNKSDIEIAQFCRDLDIDIAVDLKGFTKNARTGIFSYRVAPIQVNYLGYPGTLGADYIDYIIADKTLIPFGSESFYSEKVIYLPNSYQVNDRSRTISDKQFTRQELGLPENGFVFSCFNNNFKILPDTYSCWMRILRAVEGSVLWLFEDNIWAAENLKKEALKYGIQDSRLIFSKKLPLADHLARHLCADLFLDTFPYNAHTTASDALWAGLPVLTLMGQSFASRVVGSLLNAIRLPELITNTQEEYETLAIELAASPQKLEDIKLRLANNRLTTPLFDTPLFTKNLEMAFVKMYDRYQADLGPQHMVI